MDSKRQSTELQGVRNDTLHSSNKDVRDDESNNNYGKGDFKSFAQDTTLHGARFLFTDNVFRRFFWALAVIASLAYCIFQVVGAIKAFYDWPFSTKISKNTSYQNSELLFPAVTLCNLNSVNTRRYRDKFRRYYNEELLERKIKDLSVLTTKATNEILKPEFKDRNEELFKRLNRANDTLRTQGNISHQIGEMLLPSNSRFYSCSINGKPCTEKNFTRHMTSTYGQCYTFNSADSGYPMLHATLAGQNSGLKLHLNIERNSYIKSAVRPSVGLAMIVHDQKSFPFMGVYGMAIQPGASTLCAIKRKKMINLPKPYETKCIREQSLKDMFSLSNAYVYTKKACLIKCRNDYTIDRCGCIPPEYKAHAPFCAPNDTVLCVLPSYEEFGTSKQKLACEQRCPEPCEHVEYETAFSYSGLHTETLDDYLMEFLNNTDNTSVDRTIYEPLLNMTQSEREKYIEKNIISLNIYFEDLSYEVIRQTPVYGGWALIGNLGGTFGLFLGMSLLTILEFIDFIFGRILHFVIGLAIGRRRTGTIHAEK